MSHDEIAEEVATTYNSTRVQVNNRIGQISKFVLDVAPGDIGVMPRKGSDEVAVCWIVGDYEYVAGAEHGLRHRRAAKWIDRTFQRSTLPLELTAQFGSRKTVTLLPGSVADLVAVLIGAAAWIPDTAITQAGRALDENGEFDAARQMEDARKRIARQIAARAGQPQFRAKLLQAYDGRCVLSGCSVPEVLEAAHVVPYRGDQSNHVSNGLLLRSDLHTLMDRGLLSIEWSDDYFVAVVSESLLDGPYGKYDQRALRRPTRHQDAPSKGAVALRRELMGPPRSSKGGVPRGA
jgi:hypothetical protein